MNDIQLGSTMPITATLFDADATKYPRATVYDSLFTEVAGSPFDLAHLADGVYTSSVFTPLVLGVYIVKVTVFNDALYTEKSIDYSQGEDSYLVNDRIVKETQIISDIDTSKDQLTDTIDFNDGQAI